MNVNNNSQKMMVVGTLASSIAALSSFFVAYSVYEINKMQLKLEIEKTRPSFSLKKISEDVYFRLFEIELNKGDFRNIRIINADAWPFIVASDFNRVGCLYPVFREGDGGSPGFRDLIRTEEKSKTARVSIYNITNDNLDFLVTQSEAHFRRKLRFENIGYTVILNIRWLDIYRTIQNSFFQMTINGDDLFEITEINNYLFENLFNKQYIELNEAKKKIIMNKVNSPSLSCKQEYKNIIGYGIAGNGGSE